MLFLHIQFEAENIGDYRRGHSVQHFEKCMFYVGEEQTFQDNDRRLTQEFSVASVDYIFKELRQLNRP